MHVCLFSLNVNPYPTYMLGSSQRPFWEETSHYSNINLGYPDEEEIWGNTLSSNWSVGQELHIGLEFD